MQHGNHRMVKGGLALEEMILHDLGVTWKYYSGLCKLTHAWREVHNDIFQAWARAYGPLSAMTLVKCLPRKPIAERWGTIDGTEAYMTNAGRDRVATI
eukprot:9476814-Pyramimonas_sp.AAC.1